MRSMLAVVRDRPRLKPFIQTLKEIRELAESCGRQLGAWMGSIKDSPVKGKRHLDAKTRQEKRVTQAAEHYRLSFLRSLKPEHPLYRSAEARAARGEQEKRIANNKSEQSLEGSTPEDRPVEPSLFSILYLLLPIPWRGLGQDIGNTRAQA